MVRPAADRKAAWCASRRGWPLRLRSPACRRAPGTNARSREIPKSARRRTANSAERTLTAVMAVPHPGLWQKSAASIGSNGSTSSGDFSEIEATIHRLCDARSDDDGNRAALLSDLREYLPERWPCLIGNFNVFSSVRLLLHREYRPARPACHCARVSAASRLAFPALAPRPPLRGLPVRRAGFTPAGQATADFWPKLPRITFFSFARAST